MANEISLNLDLRHTKNPKIGFRPGTIQVDQDGEGASSQTVEVGTTDETVSFGDISNPHFVILWNIDQVNEVVYGEQGSTTKLGRLRPGAKMPAIVPWNAGAVLEMATIGTGSPEDSTAKVQVIVYEE